MSTTLSILKQLDDCARNSTFPSLDNGYVYTACSRLTGFSDKTDWRLVIEVIGFAYKYYSNQAFNDRLYCFGNIPRFNPLDGLSFEMFPISNGQCGEILEEGRWVRAEISDVRLKNQLVPVNLGEDAFDGAHVPLQHKPRIYGAEFLRMVAHYHRERLFATEHEMRERLETSLPLVLCLEEWRHPDLSKRQPPSSTATFEMIARALVEAAGSAYDPESEPPNTHWTNWPRAGLL